MKIKLYGLPTCSRCTTAKMMLDKRNIKYESITAVAQDMDLPVLDIDGEIFDGKSALMKIRSLK